MLNQGYWGGSVLMWELLKSGWWMGITSTLVPLINVEFQFILLSCLHSLLGLIDLSLTDISVPLVGPQGVWSQLVSVSISPSLIRDIFSCSALFSIFNWQIPYCIVRQSWHPYIVHSEWLQSFRVISSSPLIPLRPIWDRWRWCLQLHSSTSLLHWP